SPTQEEGAPRFECDGCHRQFRLDQGADRQQGALQQVLRALARSGHQGQSVDIAVHGLCAGCAHPERGA
ncbi:MAG: Fur family transcriptional regulator, partial [Giesbergeria sp.]